MKTSAWCVAVAVCLCSAGARAQAGATDDESGPLFAAATKALAEGRPGDAIAALEGLADRATIDPVASYDRGLAYALRVRVGAETPGDLGRAAQGFEEARELTSDAKLADDASRALVVVRSEVARRRVRAGQPVEVDPGRSLARAVAKLLSEDVWAAFCVVASLALTTGLFMRWLRRGPRERIAGGIVASVAAPLLAATTAMTLASRHDRWTLHEAVVVTASARPTDERGITLPGSMPLPEGARVEIVEARGPSTRVRFGATDAWVQASALREIARRD
jgi:hypothetical protein